MKSKRLAVGILFLILSRIIYCQNDDFGIWYGVNAEYSINKTLEIDVSTMVRTFSNASKVEEAFLEGGVTYKFNKYFSIAGGYRFTENLEDNNEFHIRHKWLADLKGSLPLENFSFSARFRFQVQSKTFYEKESDKLPYYHGRLKFKAIYKTPKFPVNPYLEMESFSALFENSKRVIDKNRFSAGLEYKIAKKHFIEAEYMFQRDYLPHLSDMNIFSIEYNFKF